MLFLTSQVCYQADKNIHIKKWFGPYAADCDRPYACTREEDGAKKIEYIVICNHNSGYYLA